MFYCNQFLVLVSKVDISMKQLNYDYIVVHYSEIGLKGKNRPFFQRVLQEQIQRKIPSSCSISLEHQRFFVKCKKASDYQEVLSGLDKVFGIAWFAPAYNVESDIKKIETFIKVHGKQLLGTARTFRISASRADKSFLQTSEEIGIILGQKVVDTFGLNVDLKHPDCEVFVDILPEFSLVYTDIHQGLRGLPVGSSGKVLSLFSGGIDSPVASWLMMRRGCKLSYIHFHAFRSAKEITGSKIDTLFHSLALYGGESTVYFVPFSEFHTRILDLNPRYELLLFRRFIVKFAEAFAQQKAYEALVMGDSVGQVASQTLPYIGLTDHDASLPILRPLISYTKEEIIDLAKKIDTYEPSIKEYKDCCSIVSAHPTLNPKKGVLEELEKKIDLPGLIEKTFQHIEERNYV